MPFYHVAGHSVQGKQAAMLSSEWPHTISPALFGSIALLLDWILHVL